MTVTVILILLCLLMLGFGIGAVELAEAEKKARKEAEKENAKLEKDKEELIERGIRERNEKARINTGNGRADFQHSIDMLQKYSNGACEEY